MYLEKLSDYCEKHLLPVEVCLVPEKIPSGEHWEMKVITQDGEFWSEDGSIEKCAKRILFEMDLL